MSPLPIRRGGGSALRGRSHPAPDPLPCTPARLLRDPQGSCPPTSLCSRGGCTGPWPPGVPEALSTPRLSQPLPLQGWAGEGTQDQGAVNQAATDPPFLRGAPAN